MSISSGTHTFGSGGTYALLSAAVADLAATLTGALTLVQVGNSIEPGTAISKSMAGVSTFKITRATTWDGSPLNLRIEAASVNMTSSQAGIMWLDNVFIKASGISWNVFGSPSGNKEVRLTDCIIVATGTGFTAAMQLSGSSTGVTNTIHIARNKIYTSGSRGISLAPNNGSSQPRHYWYIENNVVYSPTNPYYLQIGSTAVGTTFGAFVVRNNVALGASGHAFNLPGDNGTYKAMLQGCARATGSDSSAYYAYDGITVPGDILSLSEASAYFLGDSGTSPLKTNGVVPLGAYNPYTTSPYPIGVYYASPGPTFNSADLVTSAPTLAGVGYMRPAKSRIFPGATGRVSHARILAGYRGPAEAELFHNLVKEST